jgi:hypothetical protein
LSFRLNRVRSPRGDRGGDVATPADCLLIAGKSHESYQEFADAVVPFDDRQVVRELIGTTVFSLAPQPRACLALPGIDSLAASCAAGPPRILSCIISHGWGGVQPRWSCS